MKLLKNLLYATIAAGILYVAFAFFYLSFNPMIWGRDARYLFDLLTLGIIVCVFAITALSDLN